MILLIVTKLDSSIIIRNWNYGNLLSMDMLLTFCKKFHPTSNFEENIELHIYPLNRVLRFIQLKQQFIVFLHTILQGFTHEYIHIAIQRNYLVVLGFSRWRGSNIKEPWTGLLLIILIAKVFMFIFYPSVIVSDFILDFGWGLHLVYLPFLCFLLLCPSFWASLFSPTSTCSTYHGLEKTVWPSCTKKDNPNTNEN